MGNLGFGLELMVVGMLTVFVILLVVIWGGKLLIAVVNKVAPEEVVPAKKSAKPADAVDASTMAILKEVVSKITGGKGQVASARKILASMCGERGYAIPSGCESAMDTFSQRRKIRYRITVSPFRLSSEV